MSHQALDVFRTCIPLFQTLADPARQDIILLLARHEKLSVNEIADQSALSRPAISHHLKILRDNRFVQIEHKGTLRYYSLQLETSVQQLKELIKLVEDECISSTN